MPRSHEVGSKQGNLGRRSRLESCKTKWFGQCDWAISKQTDEVNAIGFWDGQSRGWSIHTSIDIQMTYS